jgi:hypothetical protein
MIRHAYLVALCGLMLAVSVSCAAEADPDNKALPVVVTSSLDAATGMLAVTIRCSGDEAVAIHQADLLRQRASIGFTLAPIGAEGVLPRAGTTKGAKWPTLVAGTKAESKPKLGAIVLSGDLTAGYAFPIWEAGFWDDLPACFELAPQWEIRPGAAITTATDQAQRGEVRGVTATRGFMMDRELWEQMETLRKQAVP